MRLRISDWLSAAGLHTMSDWVRWFGFGRCRLCGNYTLWLLRSEHAHEHCWLLTK